MLPRHEIVVSLLTGRSNFPKLSFLCYAVIFLSLACCLGCHLVCYALFVPKPCDICRNKWRDLFFRLFIFSLFYFGLLCGDFICAVFVVVVIVCLMLFCFLFSAACSICIFLCVSFYLREVSGYNNVSVLFVMCIRAFWFLLKNDNVQCSTHTHTHTRNREKRISLHWNVLVNIICLYLKLYMVIRESHLIF